MDTIFTIEQEKALKTLENAFRKCKKANLRFQGMDDNLLVWDAEDFKDIIAEGGVCDQQYKGEDGNQGDCVQTHGTYYDSGGW